MHSSKLLYTLTGAPGFEKKVDCSIIKEEGSITFDKPQRDGHLGQVDDWLTPDLVHRKEGQHSPKNLCSSHQNAS